MADVDNSVNANQPSKSAASDSPRPYLLPFLLASKALGLQGREIPNELVVTKAQFQAFMAIVLRGVGLDEQWYRAAYPDIAQAIDRGELRSAKDHFVEHGYCEGRHSGPVEVDVDWYMREYPDIAADIKTGKIKSCQEHFDAYGREEGRLPYWA